jgi:hypothetical protein
VIRDFIIGIFIAAARNAAVWPQPHRREAWAALGTLPIEHFEDFVAERFN